MDGDGVDSCIVIFVDYCYLISSSGSGVNLNKVVIWVEVIEIV